MFEVFDRKYDPAPGRRFAVSGATSLAFYGALVGAVLAAPAAKKAVSGEEVVDVSFRPPPVTPPTPEPAIPETLKIKKVKAPKPASALVAPQEVPDEKPAEADAASDVLEVADADAPAAPEAPALPPPPPPPAPKAPSPREPIALPEDADPPEPDAGNAQPEYPEAMRSAGKEGIVILKIVISDQGAVTDVKVMKGDEPFVSAAVQAVRGWRYTPARVEGQARAVYRIVKIPFRLRA